MIDHDSLATSPYRLVSGSGFGNFVDYGDRLQWPSTRRARAGAAQAQAPPARWSWRAIASAAVESNYARMAMPRQGGNKESIALFGWAELA